ncbi:hypothetical protein LP421_16905 [Rhizobium sp. RCAM05350]|nr:hypothetical protein LP421_16905 [Rhizobium sp. RCAM05350]
MDAVIHALDHLLADTVVVLQPTSPLRTAEDIRICVDMHRETGKPVVSVTAAKPWIFTKTGDSVTPAFDFATRRQDADYVSPNGAIYVFSAEYARSGRQWWLDAAPYLMPAERSIDIDTPTDLVIAKALYENR